MHQDAKPSSPVLLKELWKKDSITCGLFILELCFGLPPMPLPLHSAVSRAAGPLGEAGLVAVLLVGGRKEAVSQP